MRLYRIASCKFIRDLTGTGGLYASGRWHAKGSRIIYFSEHISLAKLEVLANSSFLPKGTCLLTVTVPDSITIISLAHRDLPKGWDSFPYVEELKNITAKWLSSHESLVLKVPSAQSAHEFNYLINPLHKDMKKVKIESVEEIKFDQRLKL